jgi:hypothetical protein
MTLENLETLNDEELEAVIARAGALLKRHDRERKEKALADARLILASAGLNLKDMATKVKGSKTMKSAGISKRAPDETGAGMEWQGQNRVGSVS